MDRLTNIAVLGSTGSIGTQTLDIINEYPDRFRASVLTAGSNHRLLAEQALHFRPDLVVINDEAGYQPLVDALQGTGIEVACGAAAIADAVTLPQIDTVLTAMVGYSGLLPTIRAIEAGKRIALSNKETLVVAGQLITDMASRYGVDIVPVDSEHSAIFQCLRGETTEQARKIFLTASGGPFRTLPAKDLEFVTAADALKHPNWSMGAKVTIDSASMMNKGFEMIEAHWLFGCPPSKIQVVVHPQSIVHSMVEFVDGSIKAQLGPTDMRLPIRYALGFPDRLPSDSTPLSLPQFASLTFEMPDMEKFPLLGLAFEAIARGGNTPCVLNAANEVAVDAFLHGRIKFTDMPRLAERTIEAIPFDPDVTLPTLVESNAEARRIALSLLSNFSI